jgi:hypothetical protein
MTHVAPTSIVVAGLLLLFAQGRGIAQVSSWSLMDEHLPLATMSHRLPESLLALPTIDASRRSHNPLEPCPSTLSQSYYVVFLI